MIGTILALIIWGSLGCVYYVLFDDAIYIPLFMIVGYLCVIECYIRKMKP